jgi:hypothetical protein
MGQKSFLKDFLGVKWGNKDFWRISWVRNGPKKFFGGFRRCEMNHNRFFGGLVGWQMGEIKIGSYECYLIWLVCKKTTPPFGPMSLS